MAIVIIDVRNCKYSVEDNSLINCEAKFTGLPMSDLDNTWLPFTANPLDVAEHGRTIFANAEKGDYGAVAAYAELNLEQELFNLRIIRNDLLRTTDWTQGADVPTETKNKWTTYRQELRDLPNGLDTAQKVRDVTWPTEPS